MNEQITPAQMDWFVKTMTLWGHIIPSAQALIFMQGIDILTGWMLAIDRHTLNSSVSYAGMRKKVSVLLFVTVGVILEPYANGLPLTLLFSTAFLFQELLSVIENMASLGVKFPRSILDVLEKVQDTRKAKLDQRALPGSSTERLITATDKNTNALQQRVDQEAHPQPINLPTPIPVVVVEDPSSSNPKSN